MFSLHSFFPTFLSEEAIGRRQQALERADNEGFCRQLVSQIVNSVDVPHIVPLRRRPGRPPGTFDVAFFCRRLVDGMLESHIRYFRKQEASKNALKAEYRSGNMISGAALQDVVACIDAHVQAKLSKPRAQSPYHVGATVMHTRSNGANVQCEIVKAHPDGFFDVSYDVHGKKVVKLRAPRFSLAVPH